MLKINKDGLLTHVELKSVTKCGEMFCYWCRSLQTVNLPALTKCGDWFCNYCRSLQTLTLPSLIECGKSFCRQIVFVEAFNEEVKDKKLIITKNPDYVEQEGEFAIIKG